MEKARSPVVAERFDPAAIGRPRLLQPVSEVPFAGRIGGNQEFTVHGDDEESEAILKKHPDAVRGPEIE